MFLRLIPLSLVILMVSSTASALTATWDNGATGGNRGRWGTNGLRPRNWDPNQTPQSVDDVAIFAGAGNSSISFEQNLAVGEIRFDSNNLGYSITGSRTLTFDVSSGSARLGVEATDTQAHTLGMSISLADDLVIDNLGSGSLTISGGIAGSAYGLTLEGTGNTILTGASSTYGGGTTLSGGTLSLGASDLLPDNGSLAIRSGTLDIGSHTDTVGALSVHSGSLLGSGSLSVESISFPEGNVDVDVDIQFSNPSAELVLTESANQVVTLRRPITHTGATRVQAGRLELRGNSSIRNSPRIQIDAGATLDVTQTNTGLLDLANGQVLGGSGRVLGDVRVVRGAQLSPGNSPGTLTTGNLEWESGGSLLIEFDDAAGTQGVGWDLIDVDGLLSISAIAGDEFVIDLASLLPSTNTPGDAANFPAAGEWTIAQTTLGISGFSADAFSLDTSGFTNSHDPSAFSLTVNGNDLVLTYGVIPEPGTGVMLGIGLSLLARRARDDERS